MNRVALAIVCVVSMLAACASSTPIQPASAGPQVSGDGTCHADRVAWAVGKSADETTMKAIWRQSGSGLIRPIAPGSTVSRDFRRDRVNVHIDAGNVITKVVCG